MASKWTKATRTKLKNLLAAEVVKGKGIIARGSPNPTACLQTARKLNTYSEKLQQAQEKFVAEANKKQNDEEADLVDLIADALEVQTDLETLFETTKTSSSKDPEKLESKFEELLTRLTQKVPKLHAIPVGSFCSASSTRMGLKAEMCTFIFSKQY